MSALPAGGHLGQTVYAISTSDSNTPSRTALVGNGEIAPHGLRVWPRVPAAAVNFTYNVDMVLVARNIAAIVAVTACHLSLLLNMYQYAWRGQNTRASARTH